jgi:hypothetical protein
MTIHVGRIGGGNIMETRARGSRRSGRQHRGDLTGQTRKEWIVSEREHGGRICQNLGTRSSVMMEVPSGLHAAHSIAASAALRFGGGQ